jgi:menaquinone-dependent protoporphyrinogen oxidase
MVMTGKILVAYCTRSGFTRSVARRIATKLRERGNDVDLADLEMCIRHPERYDVIVLGSGVRRGEHHQVMEEFITEHRDALAARPCGFFSVDRAAYHSDDPDPGGHLAHMFEKLGWKPQHAVAIAGRIDYREHFWPYRMALKILSRYLGAPTDASRDHILTEWPRVDAFAEAVAGELIAKVA